MLRLLAVLVLLLTPAAKAHEMGSTQVGAKFLRNGTYSIEMRVDPESLLSRLEFAAGQPLSDESLPYEQQLVKLRALESQFMSAVTVAFDGAPVRPRFELLPLRPRTAGANEALLRLSGEVPEGAKTFQWRYSLLYSNYLLRVTKEGNPNVVTEWLSADATSSAVPVEMPSAARGRVARQYLLLGFTHIVPKGIDHILFVLGLYLLSWKIKPVLAQVTAFTVAHTITLALTIYGVVALSPSIVEPLIALSIVYIAIENLVTRELKPWRLALVFAFGLLHGMGFAGVLGELGLPREHFVTALISFNVGVELGQLAVLFAAYLLVVSWARHKHWYRRAVVVPASLLIAAVGAFWTVERITG